MEKKIVDMIIVLDDGTKLKLSDYIKELLNKILTECLENATIQENTTP